MEVVEASIVSKTGEPQTCEDRYCVTEHYACVIDGATDVSGKRYNGRTSGQVVAGVIAETIPLLPAGADIEEVIGIINEALLRYYEANGMYDAVRESPYTRPTAAIILYSRSKHTVWMVGDCQCMIDEEEQTNPKIVDDIIANTRSLFLEAEILKGKTIEELLERDTGFEAVRPFIQMQYYMQNLPEPHPYGYAAVTGFPFDLGQIKTVQLRPDARSLALASDGYPFIRPTLQQSEDALQDILKRDPLCFREYKLAKGLVKGNASFDDRTYVRLRLQPR